MNSTPDVSPRTTLHAFFARRAAFTLVEMLIVISIISVLLGMLYGSLERAQKYSRRTITFSELKNIEAAFKQYYAHYQTWPTNFPASVESVVGGDDGGTPQDCGFLINREMAALLQGRFTTDDPQLRAFNPDGIPFIEFSRSNAEGDPVNAFKPSGTDLKQRGYKVLFDVNGNRQIAIPADASVPGSQATNIIASVAVWTVIPANRAGTTPDSGSQPITEMRFGSWDTFQAQ